MYEGKVIKFYRERANLTQEQLGRGVCSSTHVSKIERGLTEYSGEIINLLVNRLGIDMEKELVNITTIKEKLDLWQDMIITQNSSANEVEADLDNNQFISVSEYKTLYCLTKMLHHIKIGNKDIVKKHFKLLPKEIEERPKFEQNLYKHVLGSYYMMTENHPKALKLLKTIDFDIYTNPLVYYDLASAYHHNKSPVFAYYYAEKALNLFKQRNNFLGIIDAENLMIIQLESDNQKEFNETIERYGNLLELCDLVHAYDKKAKITHNYAYENFRKQNYAEAKKLYEQSMALKEPYSSVYLLSLEGVIRCGIEGHIVPKDVLLKYIEEGLEIAKEIKDTLYSHIMILHKHEILKQKTLYYDFLAHKALPYFKTNGYVVISQRYEKELFSHYIKTGQKEKALEMSISIMDYLDA
ncbi:helix-turn-helix domain-containing protein [Virgibacillus halodenitrificans]|uniref:helix-turn-helix domain-containing protein n=1 Tax=Virgibacillus halodenitrificans TaxID=1482 RepID=UPI000761A1AF